MPRDKPREKPRDKPDVIANGCRLAVSNFYITINSNKRVVLTDSLTKEEERYYERFENAWKSYFDQNPDECLVFLKPGDNSENSIKSINIDA